MEKHRLALPIDPRPNEAPEPIDIVLIRRPDLPPGGAGQSYVRPIAAALANAIFKATGASAPRNRDPGAA